ncbi:GNAT family N-acetyltransferase [Alteromonas sp. ASW11-130]|uniref:GNAT family N-acetyltransferase n=1 Tax=Alteromonas sp. ASW11-130 TaxID=3015775 RepID=UPI0022426F71|nr:GNAT family N-acetyltransferase [Alteromonas sp. ASW11-130]
MISTASLDDSPAIAKIYNHYIQHSVATFEEFLITPSGIQERMKKVQAANLPWLVAMEDSKIVGYTYASQLKERSAYRFAVEVTVYIDTQARGKGLGTALYLALFEQLKSQGIRSAIGCITLPNEPSVVLHEKLGMQKVGHFSEVGFKFGKWLDVGFWQIHFAKIN